MMLPWETLGSKATDLYKKVPPKLKYPAGSQEQSVNDRFLKRMDMYLFSNYQVRSVLVGSRPHPFLNYPRLKEYWTKRDSPLWKFDTTKTFAMLQAIKDQGHLDFHHELTELLRFGGVLSYGNIMRETYAIIYSFVDPDDLPDLEGLCEEDDGPTFRIILQRSLLIIRANHTQEIISDLYAKLDSAKLVMRPRGMAAYFGRITKFKNKLKTNQEIVSDSYLLRRTYLAIEGKHKKLDEAVSALRRAAGG